MDKLELKDFDELTLIGELNLSAVYIQFGNGMISKGKATKEELLAKFREIMDAPETFLNDTKYKWLAERLVKAMTPPEGPKMIEVPEEPKNDYPIWGKDNIEPGALTQMRNAMRLPVTVAGALMPDAHQGYGLPIGGVLATTADTIIPYAVGVDIACRMCMTIFDLPHTELDRNGGNLKKLLVKNTHFGMGSESDRVLDESIIDKPEWENTQLLRNLKDVAYRQVGSSGSGNHFVEWGVLEIDEFDAVLGVQPGKYLTLLSHSGSRGVGAKIANYYSKLAQELTRLPKELMHLAWLDMNTQEGQEYWIAMNLAGDFASACHHEIHNKMVKDLGSVVLKRVENHHNFAWREQLEDGTWVNVHRKGATPAGKDVLGVIPGTMAHPGYVVRGLGNMTSINSASHGAGRMMSRRKAIETVTEERMKLFLKKHGVQLVGGDLDEAPMAYKNIETVMTAQSDLVATIGKFMPKIVRMADRGEPAED